MATAQTHPPAGRATVAPKASWTSWAWLLLVLTILGLIAYHARMGAVSARIANRGVTGAPRPVDFRWGNDFPIQDMQWGCLGMMVLISAVCVRAWIRRPGHPWVLMTLAATGIVWQDPIMNWA